jgi:L-lactate permease
VYQQDFNPVSDSLGLTAIFAALPLICLFVLLGGFKLKAQWAARIALGMSMLVALIVYSMPVGQTALSASEGAAFGIFPIMWIVVTAIWVYNMTVATGHFAVLRRSFGAISNDQRIQAVIVAFCFGALMEALAGFGTPVAISAVMLMALGFKPIKAAAIVQLQLAPRRGHADVDLRPDHDGRARPVPRACAAHVRGDAARWTTCPTSPSVPPRWASSGSEGDLFRKVLGWSLVLILAMCALVYLQSTAVLDWMVVK